MEQFVGFFQDLYQSKLSISIDHETALVRVYEYTPSKAAEMIAGYLEHAFRVCAEGPWKVLVQDTHICSVYSRMLQTPTLPVEGASNMGVF